ncbi:MAG: hypothetical protein RLZZ84_2319 [Pseudomonadota bacterium]|jgi:mono/diheme cytochrome c family protein
MWKPLALAALPLTMAACAAVAATQPPTQPAAQQARGQAFAQAHCAACHGITANASSPNPESPPFEAVVNTRGLTAETLARFLRDSHNFPGAMAFEIDQAKIDDLAAYMVTLKRTDYRPEI